MKLSAHETCVHLRDTLACHRDENMTPGLVHQLVDLHVFLNICLERREDRVTVKGLYMAAQKELAAG